MTGPIRRWRISPCAGTAHGSSPISATGAITRSRTAARNAARACFSWTPRGASCRGDGIGIARRELKAGRILCIKGLGGMHLACLADDASACRELRRRKQRDEKPFAVMCRSVDCARRLCRVSEEEERLLASPKKPIVLLKKRECGAWAHLSENNCIGVMLPYTPLHVLLMGDDMDCLVMTSANISDTPIVYKNTEALERLSGIADGFLLHDRGDRHPLRRLARAHRARQGVPAEALAGLCALSGHHAGAGGGTCWPAARSRRPASAFPKAATLFPASTSAT